MRQQHTVNAERNPVAAQQKVSCGRGKGKGRRRCFMAKVGSKPGGKGKGESQTADNKAA